MADRETHVSLTVVCADDQSALRVYEVLSRTGVGLALDGADYVNLSIAKDDEEIEVSAE